MAGLQIQNCLYILSQTSLAVREEKKNKTKNKTQPKLWVINLSSNLYCAHFRGSSGAVFA